jgi:hypothetical protein
VPNDVPIRTTYRRSAAPSEEAVLTKPCPWREAASSASSGANAAGSRFGVPPNISPAADTSA